MDLEDITEVLLLFERNLSKLQNNISGYKRKVDAMRQTLEQNWPHVGRSDRRILTLYDSLLGSVSEVNEYVMKLNLHIKLNQSTIDFEHTAEHENQDLCSVQTKRSEDDINNNVSYADSFHSSPRSTRSEAEQCKNEAVPLVSAKSSQTELNQELSTTQRIATTAESLYVQPQTVLETSMPQEKVHVISERSMPKRLTRLVPPSGGQQLSSNDIYEKLVKNTSCFVKDTFVEATVVFLNKSEDCIYVAKWGKENIQLNKLLAMQLHLKELQQFPNFGDIFAVYDAQEQIIPRVVINSYSKGGGYDAYLIDYGEHIHLNGMEVIYELTDELKKLPAQAIRCFVGNYNLNHLSQYAYQKVWLRVIENTANDLVVELLKEPPLLPAAETSADKMPTETCQLQQAAEAEHVQKLTPEQAALLDNIEPCTSDAVKAVLGFRPKDDERICRQYDPKINGCFKGARCKLLHVPLADHDATKDIEPVNALPDTIYEAPIASEVGSTVRLLVTHIHTPTHLYAQLVDENIKTPLVWSSKDVPEPERKFKRPPIELEIVLALYNDGCYYRAQVMEKFKDKFKTVYKIFYIDYGNTEYVSIESLAPCTDAISLKPQRALSCFISGIKYITSSNPFMNANCVEFLKSKLLNVEVDVLLCSHTADGYIIELRKRFSQVPQQLIEHGFVEAITEPDEDNRSNITC
ncbi:uncharacterized protein LOC108594887 [Drosophila busckii]|uniref:uncharacterized protein LOC108594887 n=1 Tax=Drosophila busckii TaxID=30019 RepID=UPI00083F1771|nr:uncharacterized protein LOC108594887 [Drosophila busckii]